MTILVSGGFIVAAANAFLFVGQQYTTSAIAAILISLSPILTVGLTALVLPSESLTRQPFSGVFIGLVGVGIVARPDVLNPFSATILGSVLVFIAALALAVGGVALRRFQSSLSSLAITAWATLVGGLTMLTFSLARGEPILAASWTTVALLAVVYNGVIATPIGYVAYFSLLETVGPVRVNLITYVSPLVTALLGWLLLEEQVSLLTLAGFAVITAGFFLIEYRSFTREVERLRRALS